MWSTRIRILLPVSITIMLFASCKKEDSIEIDLGYDYFPIEQGRFVSYDVDSMVFDLDVQLADTFHFQVREQIDSPFIDAEGRNAALLKRYYRDDEQDDWQLNDVWTVTRTESRAEKYEENVRFVRMAFGVNEQQSWDGNAFNTEDEWIHEYTDIGSSLELNGLSYDNTVTVLQHYDSNATQIESAREIYARGVGMIYKQLDTVLTVFLTDTPRFGVKLRMEAFDFGLE